MAKTHGRKNGKGNEHTELVPGPNGGKLWSHGPPPDRQVPGPGRPPSRIREELRGDFDDRRSVLRDIADGKVPLFREVCPECGYEPEMGATEIVKHTASPADRARAMDIMAKYGLGSAKVDEALVRELAAEVGAVLESAPDGDRLLREIHDRWKPIVAARL